tara:strand:+ start:314 stop:919 length:606 start_codon:yes stop_codon:yes gene_type:complete
MGIKTIIFDLAEVYLNGLIGVDHRLQHLLNMDAEKIHKGFQGKELVEFFEGKITEDEYMDSIIERNDWKISKDVFKKFVRENFQEIEGVRDVIEDLKKQGFKLGLLSVHAKEWIEHCEKEFDYHKLFHSVMYSFEIEICKPDQRAYEHILEKLESKPEECLFIDDSLKNIESAKKLGLKTIHFNNLTQLKKELANLGINVE